MQRNPYFWQVDQNGQQLPYIDSLNFSIAQDVESLMLAARARAVLDGRLAPSVDDVVALAKPILGHRMALSFTARADGVTLDDIVAQLTAPLA
jgi:MoxR-like ATPase